MKKTWDVDRGDRDRVGVTRGEARVAGRIAKEKARRKSSLADTPLIDKRPRRRGDVGKVPTRVFVLVTANGVPTFVSTDLAAAEKYAAKGEERAVCYVPANPALRDAKRGIDAKTMLLELQGGLELGVANERVIEAARAWARTRSLDASGTLLDAVSAYDDVLDPSPVDEERKETAAPKTRKR